VLRIRCISDHGQEIVHIISLCHHCLAHPIVQARQHRKHVRLEHLDGRTQAFGGRAQDAVVREAFLELLRLRVEAHVHQVQHQLQLEAWKRRKAQRREVHADASAAGVGDDEESEDGVAEASGFAARDVAVPGGDVDVGAHLFCGRALYSSKRAKPPRWFGLQAQSAPLLNSTRTAADCAASTRT
jgi:hypothetical protein